MSQPAFGIQFILVDDTYAPVYGDFSVIGLVGPSDDADSVMFPLNTCVDVNTGDASTLKGIGTGPLYKWVERINAQLTDLQRSARAVVVRVATGGSTAETMANIIGDPGLSTGIYQLLLAPAGIGVTPRILGAPGFTGEFSIFGGATDVSYRANAVGGNHGNGTITLADPAYLTGHQPGMYQLVCVGGTTSANGAAKAGGNVGGGSIGSLASNAGTTLGTWRVICNNVASAGHETWSLYLPNGTFYGQAVTAVAYTNAVGLGFTIAASGDPYIVGDEFDITISSTVPQDGGVFSVTDPFNNPLPEATVGEAYADQIAFTINDGTTDFQVGDAFGVTVAVTGGEMLANPLCAALPPVCEALMAHAVVGGPGTTKTDAINWQTTLNSKRLIPVDNWEIIAKGALDTEFVDGAASVMGIGVRVDFHHQGMPFWSWANQPVQGLLGMKRVDGFSLVDGATDAQELLAAGIGVTVKGNHADASLTDSGWQHVSFMNASTDPQWNFYSFTRGRDCIHLALLKSIRHRLGVENVTLHGVQAVLNDMAAIAADLKSKECVIGWHVGFAAADNTAMGLRSGKFTVYFKAEQPAPILVVTIKSGMDLTALDAELAAMSTELSDVVQAAA